MRMEGMSVIKRWLLIVYKVYNTQFMNSVKY